MASVNPLGRAYNVVTSATTAGVRCSLKDAAGVGIVLIGATSGAATISEANAASGGTSQVLATTTEYWTQASGVWTRVTQAAGSTVTAATGGLLYVYVPASALSDGFKFVSVSHATGSFVLLPGDLNVQRRPANLASAVAA